MSYGQLTRFRNYKFSTKLKNSITNILNKIENLETPEKLKGTFLERWGRYWKNVYIDYKSVVEDIAKECREHPIKVSTYTAITAFCVYLNKCNPDEYSFREHLLHSNIKLIQVAEPVRNPISENHVKWLEQCYNEGVIRRLNLGIISIMWVDNYDKVCSLYKAVCPHLRPRYITFHERIIDIGCLDKWWILEDKMKDYDVNEAEFSNTNK